MYWAVNVPVTVVMVLVKLNAPLTVPCVLSVGVKVMVRDPSVIGATILDALAMKLELSIFDSVTVKPVIDEEFHFAAKDREAEDGLTTIPLIPPPGPGAP